MTVVRTLAKGQIVIPKDIRKQYNIKPGRLLGVIPEKNRIVLEPLPDNPIKALLGMFSDKDVKSLTDVLLEERRKDRKLEEDKITRFTRGSKSS